MNVDDTERYFSVYPWKRRNIFHQNNVLTLNINSQLSLPHLMKTAATAQKSGLSAIIIIIPIQHIQHYLPVLSLPTTDHWFLH